MKTHPPVLTNMLIRRPASEVFSHFVEPQKLSRFWLSRATEKLEQGKTVEWHFKIAGAFDHVRVVALEPSKRIVIRWDGDVEVEWTFEDQGKETTMVTIEIRNIPGSADEQFSYAVDVSQGFTIALLELKALLEKNVTLNAIYDKFPQLPHA